ncbi:serine/threonine-protein kinase [Streptomyces sp. NPDC059215]|uniref:serine/threonine-protein kinase n=1 Tax=Streptomyces sp. NPDC059215 TaxID=3346772 RepID=UPI0036D09A61
MSDLGRVVAGRYLLVERVGSGGMGTVWRAEDKLLGRDVAVKKLRIPPHLHDDEVQTLHERTRREARSAARITHPHVIVVHDVVDDEGLPCIVMEYIPSRTLGDVLKEQGALPAGEVARIGRAMTSALRAAHEVGVLHRDVKPANVLLGNDGRVVLTDFGIAMESGSSSLTKSGELIGSIRYLAPERLRSGSASPGPASDLWALGVTMYQAVEGRYPFGRETPIETAYAIASEPHEPPRNAGRLTSVIEGLLVKNPEQRLNAHQVERRLSDVTGTPTTHLDSPTRLDRAGPLVPSPGRVHTRRRTVLWWVVAVALVVCVAGSVLRWQRDAFGERNSHVTRGDASSPSATTTHPVPQLPAGYHLEKAGRGFSVPVRNGWTSKSVPGGEAVYIDPSGLVGLRINVVQFAGTDPLQHWRETQEEQTRRDNPGYERVRMDATTFRGRPAGYWEFTFNGRARKYRAAEVAIAGADDTQYVVYLSAPDAQWHKYRPVFDATVNGIRLSNKS